MTLLLGGIGWGLLSVGAFTHLWHHDRLRELLSAHTDHERPAAAILTLSETALAVLLPVAVWQGGVVLTALALAGLAVGLGFVAWIGRLLLSGSTLPCACSFSTGPTSPWSLARAIAIVPVGALAFVGDLTATELTTTLAAALAVASALFVVPEALQWPQVSRAQLARLDAHAPTRRETEA